MKGTKLSRECRLTLCCCVDMLVLLRCWELALPSSKSGQAARSLRSTSRLWNRGVIYGVGYIVRLDLELWQLCWVCSHCKCHSLTGVILRGWKRRKCCLALAGIDHSVSLESDAESSSSSSSSESSSSSSALKLRTKVSACKMICKHSWLGCHVYQYGDDHSAHRHATGNQNPPPFCIQAAQHLNTKY